MPKIFGISSASDDSMFSTLSDSGEGGWATTCFFTGESILIDSSSASASI
jgi:hypothetical protein